MLFKIKIVLCQCFFTLKEYPCFERPLSCQISSTPKRCSHKISAHSAVEFQIKTQGQKIGLK